MGLVCKETVVLCRWESEKQNFDLQGLYVERWSYAIAGNMARQKQE